ncbi:MAG: ribonuclease III [Ruminococcaceae bacterium]|nr:ribonuclease III [Oscillospiraceae bacterium]
MNVNTLSPSTLAFVGDAYYGLLVRELLAETNRPSGELHSASVKLVKAGAQAEAFKAIQPHLTEQEISIYKRGRNAHVNSIPKNSTVSEYHSATGIETLFGYLHLSGNDKRAKELFALILENFREKL